MTPFARARRSPSLRSFRHRAYRRMALANLVSTTGSWMQTIAQSWVVLELTGSTAALGGSVAVQAAPTVLLGLWGGAVVDRLDKRRLLVGTQVLLAAAAAVLAVVASTPMLSVGTMYVLGFVTGLVRVLDGPAHATFGTQLVDRDELANAAALGSAISSVGRIVGMSLGGAAVAVVGAPAVFWFNAISYAGVAVAALTIRPGDLTTLARSAPGAGGIRAGLRHVGTRPELVVVLGLSFFLSSFGRNFQVTMAAMTEGVLGLGAAAYGTCSTALAIGGLVGAAAATRASRPVAGVVMAVAGVTAGMQALSGLMPGLASFATVMVAVGGSAVVLDTLLATHVQLAVDDEFRGRVVSVMGLVAAAGSAVGAPVLGALADAFGARGALLLGGGVAGAATFVAWALLDGRRTLGRASVGLRLRAA